MITLKTKEMNTFGLLELSVFIPRLDKRIKITNIYFITNVKIIIFLYAKIVHASNYSPSS